MASLGHRCNFQRVSRLGSVTAWHSSSGRQPDFAALKRGRHLYLAGRLSRWALAHILVLSVKLAHHQLFGLHYAFPYCILSYLINVLRVITLIAGIMKVCIGRRSVSRVNAPNMSRTLGRTFPIALTSLSPYIQQEFGVWVQVSRVAEHFPVYLDDMKES